MNLDDVQSALLQQLNSKLSDLGLKLLETFRGAFGPPTNTVRVATTALDNVLSDALAFIVQTRASVAGSCFTGQLDELANLCEHAASRLAMLHDMDDDLGVSGAIYARGTLHGLRHLVSHRLTVLRGLAGTFIRNHGPAAQA